MKPLTSDFQKPGLALAIAFLTVLSPGCGKQGFVPAASTTAQSAPGSYFTAPRVDIVLAESDAGAMWEAYPGISSQLQGFVSQLDSQNWDYHFAVTPLSTARPFTQIVASHYDQNWGAAWTPPYPGAVLNNNSGEVNPADFRVPGAFGGFLTQSDINTTTGYANEPGFRTLFNALTNLAPGTGLIRPDALLVILVVSDGQDTSGVTYCNRGDGVVVPDCNGTNTQTTSFNQYLTSFENLKPGHPEQIKFFAAVSQNTVTNGTCLGANSFQGSRYINMANSLGGASFSDSFDICTNPISNIFSSVASNLQSVKLGFVTSYLFINQAPNVSTIHVRKYYNGNASNFVDLANDPANGWTYSPAGQPLTVNAISSPFPMNLTTGYAIQLNGPAQLIGDDTADVTFIPADVHSSP